MSRHPAEAELIFACANATGGVAGYKWTLAAGTLPGLQLSANGAISGVPAQSGTNQFTVCVTDAGSSSTNQTLSLVTIGPIYLQAVAVVSSNVCQWQLTGRPDRPYVLEATTNLVAPVWVPVTTNSAPDGLVILTDLAPTVAMKFYRTREQ